MKGRYLKKNKNGHRGFDKIFNMDCIFRGSACRTLFHVKKVWVDWILTKQKSDENQKNKRKEYWEKRRDYNKAVSYNNCSYSELYCCFIPAFQAESG